ncbi:MAG: pseudouridine synthase [Myxococcota bacterium]
MCPQGPRRPTPDSQASGVRLQKLIAQAGIASRRRAEQLILSGRVSLNGRVIRELGTRAHPERDRIEVDGRRLGRPPALRSYLVYKPRGVVSTTRDPHSRRTVLDLVPRRDPRERLFPVGRLDAASEGLMLLTNDGEAAHALLHPAFEVPRVYRVSVEGRLRAEALRQMTAGIELEGERLRVADARLLESSEERSVVELTLAEGRRHQIRRLLSALGHPVRRLVRIRFGPLVLSGLRPGGSRPLSPRERHALARMIEGASR